MTTAIPVAGTVYAALLNHRAALDALGDAVHDKPYGKPPVAPVLYVRPANTWSAHGASIALPADVDEVDVEATIGVVFGRATARVTRDDALDHVAGYVVAADLTVPHASVYRPAIRQRNRNGFCVFGATVVDAAAVTDPDAVDVSIDIDADREATAGTCDLVRDVRTLVADVAAFMQFDAGDVLLVGAIGRPVRARRGAQIRIDAEGIGAVSFAIAPVAEADAPLDATTTARRSTGRTVGRKRGRIAWQGAIHDVVEDDGRVRLADGRAIGETEPVWLPPFAPVARPRSIYALGLNYADHAKELAFKAPDEPLVFMKGESAFVGHRATTARPKGATYMHYECELAVVIGRTARGVKRDDAYDFIAGYSVANDYAIRDDLENYYRPNLKVKNRARTTPVGPWLVDASLVPDPMTLALTTRVDGEVTQQGNTCDMIFDVPFLVEWLSSICTLSPGDVILTGTPEGLVDTPVGATIETTIDGIGTLVNTIVADEGAA